jgi:hypothetical protein
MQPNLLRDYDSLEKSSKISYNDSKNPRYGASDVQSTLDIIKAKGKHQYVYAHFEPPAIQSIPDSANTVLTQWTIQDSTNGITLVQNSQGFKVASGGHYMLNASVQFQGAQGGQRNVEFTINGVNIERGRINVTATNDQAIGPYLNSSTQVRLDDNDVVGIRVYQSSRKKLNVTAACIQLSKLDLF